MNASARYTAEDSIDQAEEGHGWSPKWLDAW